METILTTAGTDLSETLKVLHSLAKVQNISPKMLNLHKERSKKFWTSIINNSILDAAIIGGYINVTEIQCQLLAHYGFASKYMLNSINGIPFKDAEIAEAENQIELLGDIFEASKLIDSKEPESLAESLKEIYACMTKNLDAKPDFRATGDSPSAPDYLESYEFPAAKQIPKEVERIFTEFLNEKSENLLTRSANFYLDFLKLSPFASHNNLISAILLSSLLKTSSYFPVTSFSKSPESYQNAVLAGFGGDTEPMEKIIAENQIHHHLGFIGLTQSVQETQTQNELTSALLEIPVNEEETSSAKRIEIVKSNVQNLWQESISYFQELADEHYTGEDNQDFAFVDSSNDDDEERRHWYLYQVVTTAKKFTYWATPAAFHCWSKLGYTFSDHRFEIFLSFHSTGKNFTGSVAATMCCYSRKVGMRNIDNFEVLCENPLIILPENDLDKLQKEFTDWLKKGTLKGIALSRALKF